MNGHSCGASRVLLEPALIFHRGKFQVFYKFKLKTLHQSYQFGVLGRHAVGILNESLELVVLCEGDDLQHSPKLGENLEGRQRDSQEDLFLYSCSEIM